MNEALHPRATLVVVAAWLVVAAWCLLALLIVQFGLSQFQSLRGTWPFAASVTVLILAAFVAVGFAYVVFAILLRCPACGRRFFIEMPGPRHPKVSRVWGMDHWASSVVTVLRKGQCGCMSCGFVIRVRP